MANFREFLEKIQYLMNTLYVFSKVFGKTKQTILILLSEVERLKVARRRRYHETVSIYKEEANG